MRHIRLVGRIAGVIGLAALVTLAAWAFVLVLAVVGACMAIDDELDQYVRERP